MIAERPQKTGNPETAAKRAHLQHVIEHAAHLLPTQGPIGVFIHHNTLHAFQHLPFEQAVQEAARRFETEPFMTETAYRKELSTGRIRGEDLDAVLAREADEEILPTRLKRRQLRRMLLDPGLRAITPENIEWLIDEDGLLDRLRPDLPPGTRQSLLDGDNEAQAVRALFAACYHRMPGIPTSESALPARPERPRDALLALCETDTDEIINAWLIRFCAVFLDQGLSYWPMPLRELGFYQSVRGLMAQLGLLPPALLAGLKNAFQQQEAHHKTSEDVVLDCLHQFGVPESEWESVITAELLALPGWAGLMHKLEMEPGLAPHEQVPCSLIDFLAVRLTMTVIASENAWRLRGPASQFWSQWRQPLAARSPTEAQQIAQAARTFDAAQLLGLSAAKISSLPADEFKLLVEEINAFDDWERRRVWHLAYEHRHEQEILRPLLTHRATVDPRRSANRPAAQVIFCIDEREESTRRALEEIAPSVETLGAAGFFGIAVNYQGLDDAHGVALCPVVVTPKHAVQERPKESDLPLSHKRQSRRKLWSEAAHHGFIGSRTLVRGWLGALGFGWLSLFPLTTRLLTPRLAGRLYTRLGNLFLPSLQTELTLMRDEAASPEKVAEKSESMLPGFTIQEMAERISGTLRAAGLIENHSRLVAILGHGSTSLNNPHESAHDCGACGGRRGGPNARSFAAMANHPQVRARMRELGMSIPDDTWFVGGYHDTSSDLVEFFDTAAIPATHATEFSRLTGWMDQARAAEALERARRFEAAYRVTTPEVALRHVEERAEHLAEPRPEYGHCTNAVCVVGRRSVTRGLFLDRRAFLISYDPDRDPENNSLAAILGAAGPVCAGINLEYYFSFVDNEGYGCGTKLPHNVTGLIGVMNGHASDLRTGLPWQMVEIHEPVRLLLIVENTPQNVMEAVGRSREVTELVENRWIRLATMDPVEGSIHIYRHGVFEPLGETVQLPEIASSADWFRGKLEHLPIARVTATAAHASSAG